jgi:hypothetical protein
MMSMCEIDFFNIDTSAFINVKDYHQIIDDIRILNLKLGRNVGIIAELRGRKIKPELINFPLGTSVYKTFYVLKKGTKISLTNVPNKINNIKKTHKIEKYEIILKLKDLHRLIKIGDKIIINDNKGSMTVKEIKIIHKESSSNLETSYNLVKKSKTLGCLPIYNPEEFMRASRKGSMTLIYNEPDTDDFRGIDNYIDFKIDDPYSINQQTEIYPNISRSELEEFELMRKRSNLIKAKSKFQDSRYEIICSVDYDCLFNLNSYLYMPNIDFVKYNIDLLSCREVAEIASLTNLKVNFICISISHVQDIESLKEVLGVKPNLKILASIVDFKSMAYINDIVKYSDAIVISRTFQNNNDTKAKILHQTKTLINKTKEFCKPIYTYIDVDEDLMLNQERKMKAYNKFNNLYSLTDEYDGFIVYIKFSDKNFEGPCKLTNELISYLKEINNDKKTFNTDSQAVVKNYDFCQYKSHLYYDIIYNYLYYIKDSILAYIGNKYSDLLILQSIGLRNIKVLISDDTELLLSSKLYANVFIFYNNDLQNLTLNYVKQMIKEKFGSDNIVLMNGIQGTLKLNINN